MQGKTINDHIALLEAELRAEKSAFAKAFHRGKSMSDLSGLADKIHQLEQKFKALTFQEFNNQ